MISKNLLRSILPVIMTALAGAVLFPIPAVADLSISVNLAPPELPVYDQPPLPDDGYIWTPGYWAWSDDEQDYYWVPGTWVEAPEPDYLWTPGYWGAEGAVFLWHAGYWGPHVGFYGGVNYGHGYGGNGYDGGYWQGGRLFYNRAVVNVGSTHVTNVYNKTVINNVTINRVSYNGGRGGVQAQPSGAQMAAARERHIELTPNQRQHEQAARSNPQLRMSANKGVPPIAATPRPGAFSGAGVAAARQGGRSTTPPAAQPRSDVQRPAPAPAARPQAPAARPAEVTPADRPRPVERPPAPRETQERAPEVVQPRQQPQTPRPEARPPAPRPEAPRPEAPRAEAPRAAAPRAAAPHPEAPRAEPEREHEHR